MPSSTKSFQTKLLRWYDTHGRKTLPWKQEKNPYHIWLSEVMLQQTQVSTVIPYFYRFISELPTIHQLAQASEEKVLSLWSGLGYYSRAKNLHQCAKVVVDTHLGKFPTKLEELIRLPGIGPSTAGAISAFAYDLPTPILDGNVKRILIRQNALSTWPDNPKFQKILWSLAKKHTPSTNAADYTQAIMDLGATICTRNQPKCQLCPIADSCQARRASKQDSLPQKKPKLKKKKMWLSQIIITDETHQHILLERRSNQGIWPNLWSTPLMSTSNPSPIVRQLFGIGHTLQPLPTYTHALTHRQITIKPYLCYLRSVPDNHFSATHLKWTTIEALSELGINKPTQKITQQLLAHKHFESVV